METKGKIQRSNETKFWLFAKMRLKNQTLSLMKKKKDGGVKVIKLEMKRRHMKWSPQNDRKYPYCLSNKMIYKHVHSTLLKYKKYNKNG